MPKPLKGWPWKRWTVFREYKAIHGPEDARGFRVKAAQAGRAWVTHRVR